MTIITTRAGKGSLLTHSEMDDNLKQSASLKSADYAVVLSDNRTNIEVTTAATITLPNASTIASQSNTGDFQVSITHHSIAGSGVITVGKENQVDIIAGKSENFIISDNETVTFKVNNLGNGYTVLSGNTRNGVETYSNKKLKDVEFTGTQTGFTGNAGSATRFEAPQSLNFTGDVTTSFSFDGSVTVSPTLVLGNGKVTNAKLGAQSVTQDKLSQGMHPWRRIAIGSSSNNTSIVLDGITNQYNDYEINIFNATRLGSPGALLIRPQFNGLDVGAQITLLTLDQGIRSNISFRMDHPNYVISHHCTAQFVQGNVLDSGIKLLTFSTVAINGFRIYTVGNGPFIANATMYGR